MALSYECGEALAKPRRSRLHINWCQIRMLLPLLSPGCGRHAQQTRSMYTQCCFDVGPASTTLSQHQNNIGSAAPCPRSSATGNNPDKKPDGHPMFWTAGGLSAQKTGSGKCVDIFQLTTRYSASIF